jgi:hypothetical protein
VCAYVCGVFEGRLQVGRVCVRVCVCACVCVCVCVFESRLQVGRDGSVWIACVGTSLSPHSLLVFFVYAAAGLCLRALLLLSLPPCCCCLAAVALVSLSPHSFNVLLWQSLLLLRSPRFLLLRSPSVLLLSGSLVRVRRCCRALAALPLTCRF